MTVEPTEQGVVSASPSWLHIVCLMPQPDPSLLLQDMLHVGTCDYVALHFCSRVLS